MSIAVLVGGTVLTGDVARSASARASTTLCGQQTTQVDGGYIVQNNEFNSQASECVSTSGGRDFKITGSGIDTSGGMPGAYPSIYSGNHWGARSSGGLASNPLQVSALGPGRVTSDWATIQDYKAGAYDVSYDIWTSKTPSPSGGPDGTEVMIWLNHNGDVSPAGSKVASGVSVGGRAYDIWYHAGSGSPGTVTYAMTAPTYVVQGLDIGQVLKDAANRGYVNSSEYLIDVEAGFELWHGGAGLATTWFQVNQR